jgi:hypothetical protein
MYTIAEVVNLNKKEYLGDPTVDDRKILKWIFKK